jgi:hypothetical protein
MDKCAAAIQQVNKEAPELAVEEEFYLSNSQRSKAETPPHPRAFLNCRSFFNYTSCLGDFKQGNRRKAQSEMAMVAASSSIRRPTRAAPGNLR